MYAALPVIDPGSWWFANKLALTMIGNSDSHSLIGPRWIVCVTSLALYRGTEKTSWVSPSQEITNVRWANVLFTGEDLPLSLLAFQQLKLRNSSCTVLLTVEFYFDFVCGIGRTYDIVRRQPSSATEIYCAANCIWMGSRIREWRGLLTIPFYCSKCLVYLSSENFCQGFLSKHPRHFLLQRVNSFLLAEAIGSRLAGLEPKKLLHLLFEPRYRGGQGQASTSWLTVATNDLNCNYI